MDMDWFERITGFREAGPERTRALLAVEAHELVSRVNGSRHGIGRFEVPTLAELRRRGTLHPAPGERTRVACLVGDARALHSDARFAGALFQVASQFNALEMVGPHVTPEAGVTRYADDPTQGPACAIAAGAGTIWRNDFMPLPARAGLQSGPDQVGQTATRQLDTLAGLQAALAQATGLPASALWTMQNGYALATRQGLGAITQVLTDASEVELDRLRGELAVAVHIDVDVTDVPTRPRPTVSQVYASALPVSYSGIEAEAWAPLAQLVLEAAYEATLRIACERRHASGCPTVLLTRLGGGAFGNDDDWIDAAMRRALRLVDDQGLDVRLVSRGVPHPSLRAIAGSPSPGS